MKSFLTIIKSDYLTHVRSYSFLVTLCLTMVISYTFVPEPNASYSTIRIGDYVGYYNSAWFGYVTAMMTSIFLSLIGFYLINSSIKKDIKTRVGYIIASTRIGNFTYLFSKAISNFLVLSTIVIIIFTMSIILFFLYNDGSSFEVFQFITPYLIITLPSLFCISILAVIFEVLLSKYAVIQNVVFFFLFSLLMVFSPKNQKEYTLDIIGNKIVIDQMEEMVSEITNHKTSEMTIGYVLGNTKQAKKFSFNGVAFTPSFIFSRFLWCLSGILLLTFVSLLFHRFNIKPQLPTQKNMGNTKIPPSSKEIILYQLPKPETNYSILPFIKTELFLLLRKGNKWLWAINLLGMILLATLSLEFAHQIVLPILWFLQVSRLSDLTTKEVENNIFYFTFSSYQPLKRLLTSQIISGVSLMLFLAMPLLFRYIFLANLNATLLVILGAICIVIIAAFLGVATKGKKLFEILFFFITYANINAIPFVDYFGGTSQDTTQILTLLIITLLLSALSYFKRNYDLSR